MLKNILLTPILPVIYLASFAAKATPTNMCENLFTSYKVPSFEIAVQGKKSAQKYIEVAFENLNIESQTELAQSLLLQIAEEGTSTLTLEQKKFISQFRQNSSYMRSVFQTSSLKHRSPKYFANFVRDFGHLKDMVLIEESDKAQKMSIRILAKYDLIDFKKMLKNVKPATRKSTFNYFKSIIKSTTKILSQPYVTVDDLHDVRKNLRDVLRYLQIQNEVGHLLSENTSVDYQLGQDDSVNDTPEILFLKKTNRQLGKICDENAGLIIQGQLSEDTIIEFPPKLKMRVQYIIQNFKISTEEI